MWIKAEKRERKRKKGRTREQTGKKSREGRVWEENRE